LNRESTVRDWLADPRGRAVFEPMFQQMISQLGAAMGTDSPDSAAIGMDMMGFLLETPLLSLLHFQESALPMGADELVDGLLYQIHGR
jgi:beta-glucosidase